MTKDKAKKVSELLHKIQFHERLNEDIKKIIDQIGIYTPAITVSMYDHDGRRKDTTITISEDNYSYEALKELLLNFSSSIGSALIVLESQLDTEENL